MTKPHKVVAPEFVRRLCKLPDVWVVGGSAKYMAGRTDDQPRDYDLAITSVDSWQAFLQIMMERREPPKFTTFGGFRFDEAGIEVDVWFDSIEALMTNPHTTRCYQLGTNSYWEKQ